MNRYVFVSIIAICVCSIAPAVNAQNAWTVDSQSDWIDGTASQSHLQFQDGMVVPTDKTATQQSKIKSFDKNRSAKSITVSQSPVWENWEQTDDLGPVNLGDAPVMLSLGPDNYWMFGRYGSGRKRGDTLKLPRFVPEPATLEGFDVPLQTTQFPNQFDAPGGLKPRRGGYHAWQSKDMVNWVHHGPITEKKSAWMTTAEYADGKAYFYYDDFPGFAKQVAKTPARLDLSELPPGFGFQFEIKIKDTTENPSQPILDKIELKLEIFEPAGFKAADHRSAIVFFFGGGWSGGDRKQFYQQAKVMAEQGMLANSADYRVNSRNQTTPFAGKDHGSFFRKRNGDADFDVTMQRSIEFVKAQGFPKLRNRLLDRYS